MRNYTIIAVLAVSLILVSPVLAVYEISNGSVQALYHLEDTVDSSGNGFNMTNTGGATFSVGKLNNGVDFGASNSTKYLTVSNNLNITTNSVSISGWFKVSTAPTSGNYESFFGSQNDITDLDYDILYWNNGGTLTLKGHRGKSNVADFYIDYPVTLTLDTWYFLNLTYNASSGDLRMYVNGTEVANGNNTGYGNNPISEFFKIGNGYGGVLSGMADEVFVSNIVLTTSTISSIYNSGTGQEICVSIGCGGGTSTSTATSTPATLTLYYFYLNILMEVLFTLGGIYTGYMVGRFLIMG